MTEPEMQIDVELLLPFQITQLHAALNAQARAIISKHGDLTLPQWRIIRLVSSGVASTTTAVRKAAHIDKGQFSKTLNALVQKELVELTPLAQDKRQYSISLTVEGRAAIVRLAPELDARHAHLLDALSTEERAVIFSAIQALAEAAKRTEFPSEQSVEESVSNG